MSGSVHCCQLPMPEKIATSSGVILGPVTLPMKNTGDFMVWGKGCVSENETSLQVSMDKA